MRERARLVGYTVVRSDRPDQYLYIDQGFLESGKLPRLSATVNDKKLVPGLLNKLENARQKSIHVYGERLRRHEDSGEKWWAAEAQSYQKELYKAKATSFTVVKVTATPIKI